MKRFISYLGLFSVTCIALCLIGCQHEAYYEDDIMDSVVFENKTEHSFHLSFSVLLIFHRGQIAPKILSIINFSHRGFFHLALSYLTMENR